MPRLGLITPSGKNRWWLRRAAGNHLHGRAQTHHLAWTHNLFKPRNATFTQRGIAYKIELCAKQYGTSVTGCPVCCPSQPDGIGLLSAFPDQKQGRLVGGDLQRARANDIRLAAELTVAKVSEDDNRVAFVQFPVWRHLHRVGNNFLACVQCEAKIRDVYGLSGHGPAEHNWQAVAMVSETIRNGIDAIRDSHTSPCAVIGSLDTRASERTEPGTPASRTAAWDSSEMPLLL